MVRDAVGILGIPIDIVTMEGAVERILDAAQRRIFFQIATVNLDFLVHSRQEQEVNAILRASAINVPDGFPVVWAARSLGRREAGRVAGADLVPTLMEAAARSGLGVFFLGGENGSAAEAAGRMESAYPGLVISVMEPPAAALDDMDDEAILDAIHSAAPNLLLVAFGHPKQDKWIYRHRESLPMAAMGVGCSLDIIAGRRSRAPNWVQSIGMEWGYRLAHEPMRLGRRYAGDAGFVLGVLVPWVIAKRLGVPRSATISKGLTHASPTLRLRPGAEARTHKPRVEHLPRSRG